jgi:hypothetical protein
MGIWLEFKGFMGEYILGDVADWRKRTVLQVLPTKRLPSKSKTTTTISPMITIINRLPIITDN